MPFPKPTHAWPPPSDCMFGAALLPGVTVGEALGIAYRVPPGGVTTTPYNCRTNPHPLPRPISRVIGAGRDDTIPHEQRDITDEPSTTLTGQWIGHQEPKIVEYRWSDAMLRKHPPASPASPASTILGKFYKGGAEGLLRIDDPKHPVNHPDRPGVTQRGGGDGHSAPDHTTLLAIDTKQKRTRRPVDEPSPTVAHDSRHHLRECGIFVRRLTPLECARLQSVPDSFVWPDGITKTAMYKIVGNGWACAHAAAYSEALHAADPDSRTVIDLFCGGGLGAVGWHGMYWRVAESEAA